MTMLDHTVEHAIAPQRRPRRRPQFPRRVRRVLLTAHIASSVSWLGLAIGYLTMAVTGLVTTDPTTQHGVYVVIRLVANVLIMPISLLALTTGILVAIGSGWGLTRHYWVLTKFSITILTVVLSAFAFRSGANEAAAVMASVPADALAPDSEAAEGLVFAGGVSTSLYLFMTVLSVFKPWGRVRRSGSVTERGTSEEPNATISTERLGDRARYERGAERDHKHNGLDT